METDKPKNCGECSRYDGMCALEPKIWESWRTLEKRRPKWCPLDANSEKTLSQFRNTKKCCTQQH